MIQDTYTVGDEGRSFTNVGQPEADQSLEAAPEPKGPGKGRYLLLCNSVKALLPMVKDKKGRAVNYNNLYTYLKDRTAEPRCLPRSRNGAGQKVRRDFNARNYGRVFLRLKEKFEPLPGFSHKDWLLALDKCVCTKFGGPISLETKGESPTHPYLLDWLALRLPKIKKQGIPITVLYAIEAIEDSCSHVEQEVANHEARCNVLFYQILNTLKGLK